MLALAHAVVLALGKLSRRKGTRHGRCAAGGLSVVRRRLHGGHRSDGLQRHIAPDWLSVPGAKPQRFSGGPSRACGWAAVHPGITSATPKAGRALGALAAASCRSAIKPGLALAGAASDNKSMHTDAELAPF